MGEILNRVAEIRKARQLRAAAVAEAVGVSRQTIYAIESGNYTPNTAVALRLARTLGTTVEELFALPGESTGRGKPVDAQLLVPAADGHAVRLCRVDASWVAVPAYPIPEFLPDADALLGRVHGKRARVHMLEDASPKHRQVLVAGCDPAIAFLASAAREEGIEVVAAPANSQQAMEWLKQRRVHVAGTHLREPEGGGFNVSHVVQSFGKEAMAMVTYATWEQGFVVAKGNPKGIRDAGDLGGGHVRMVNRETGAGARALLDRVLREAGVPARGVAGYGDTTGGHMSAAMAVASGRADCCIATAAAAQAFHLDFLPLQTERYDFVFRDEDQDQSAIRALLEVLQRATLRQKLRSLAGYDTTETGKLVAH